jgi:NitT/TauT family transport system substrate-binding protein
MVAGAGLVAVALAASACGSSGGSGTAAPKQSAGEPTTVGEMTIGVSVPATVSTELYIAQTQGFYQKHGVDVTLTVTGATTATQAAAGRVDLVQQGCSSSLAPAASGRQTTIAYWLVGNNAGVQVASNSSITKQADSTDSLLELAGKRVGVVGVGGGAFGMANSISAYLKSKGKAPVTIVNQDNAAAVSASLISGQIDAAVGPADTLAGAIGAGKVKILIDADDPVMAPLGGGTSIAGICLWGLKSQLQSKPKVVAAFIAALRDAYKYVSSTDPSVVAGELHTSKDFATLPVSTIEDELKLDLPFLTTTAGQMSQDVWNRTLSAFSTWGLGLKLDNPAFTYSSIVDMSYWNAATVLTGGK